MNALPHPALRSVRHWRLKHILKSFPRGMAFIFIFLLMRSVGVSQEFMPGAKAPARYKVDHRIDNMGYWKRMAQFGLVPVAPVKAIPPATPKTSLITDAAVASPDSPDVPVTELNSTQSENSVFISPNDRLTVLNSNNSSANPYPGYFLGADAFFTLNGGDYWEGQINGAGGTNMGDPSTAINGNGRWFVGFIHSGGGQALAYSNDQGTTWKIRAIAAPPSLMGGLLDKSHLWVDNSLSSPYRNNMYDGWTVITGPDDGKLQISRSTDKGLGWQIPVTISDSVHAGSHNQGVNINTGPNGEVYAVWAIYDAFPGDENALGFARSFNGGQTWQPASRIINSIRGIRTHGVNYEMRVNSFPSMTVDNSFSPWRGKIYVVWSNVNEPGVNSGTGVDIYMIASADSGATWSAPVRINQDQPLPGKQHFFPWITCDPANGSLSVVFYDDREAPPGQIETWVAVSTDGGANWQDFRVSDVAFTPAPVTGLADEYFGDYLGIAAREGMVYPSWTDNRNSVAQTFVSPFRLGPEPGEPYIAYQSSHYNDSVSGNGNSLAEYGEEGTLDLSLRNLGDTPDSNVFVTLETDSQFLSILDSTENFGNFLPWESRTIAGGFRIKVSDSVPNGERLILSVTTLGQSDSAVISYFTLQAHAPELRIRDMIVDDSAGNNNHSLDPGETCTVRIRLENPTVYPAEDVICSLYSLQDFVQMTPSALTLGDMAAGEIRDAIFQVTVDTVLAGTLSQFVAEAGFSERKVSKTFRKKIGNIIEDWETGDFMKFNWTFAGDRVWKMDTTYQFEGRYCVRSGIVGRNQSAAFQIRGRALTYDSISFFRKVSSEEHFDFLNFYIDGSRVGQWSGDQDWERVVFPLVPGYHDFKWEYVKDPEVVVGMDAGFIDLIEFPCNQYTTSDAGKDATFYECQLYTCQGIVTYADSLRWTTTGSGSFSDPTQPKPQYTPGQSDLDAGFVTLILTAYGSTVNDLAIDSVNLTILPRPKAFAGPDTGICAGDVFRITGSSAVNYTSLTWSTTGTGTFSDPAILMPVYFPGTEDLAAGSTRLILTCLAGNNDACNVAYDTLNLNFYPLPVIPLVSQVKRCTGYSALLDATAEGATSYLWTPGNFRTAQISVDTTGTGVGTVTYSVTVTGEYGCTSTASAAVTFEECNEKVQVGNLYFRVYPNPSIEICYLELFSAVKQDISVSLSTISGAQVMQLNSVAVSGQQIIPLELKNLGQGTYILTIEAEDTTASTSIIVL